MSLRHGSTQCTLYGYINVWLTITINLSLSNTSIPIYVSLLMLLISLVLIGSIWPELWSTKHWYIHMVYIVSNHILITSFSIIILHTMRTILYYFAKWLADWTLIQTAPFQIEVHHICAIYPRLGPYLGWEGQKTPIWGVNNKSLFYRSLVSLNKNLWAISLTFIICTLSHVCSIYRFKGKDP